MAHDDIDNVVSYCSVHDGCRAEACGARCESIVCGNLQATSIVSSAYLWRACMRDQVTGHKHLSTDTRSQPPVWGEEPEVSLRPVCSNSAGSPRLPQIRSATVCCTFAVCLQQARLQRVYARNLRQDTLCVELAYTAPVYRASGTTAVRLSVSPRGVC